ncbi:MAG: 1-acyl-sn-glycerol-3-phosphate acyltransferase [Pseudonocardiaceae bacterium]|nr:1-acyl-sn-glycerol-3-phosphate acyltransferase [Pseudonocardiaceae bacterium]
MVVCDDDSAESTRRPGASPPPAPLVRRTTLWRVMMALDRGLVGLLGRLHVTGTVPERLRGRPLLMVANHIGVFDAFVLIAACREIGITPRFLLTAGLLDAPIMGPALRVSGHLRVDRGKHNVAEAFGRAVRALHSTRDPILVYPEGRISHDPGLWPERGKTGAARMALAAGVPVLPVSQWGAHEAVCWGTETVTSFDDLKPLLRSGVRSMWRQPRFQVHFGEPVGLDDLSVERPGDAVRAHARIMRAIAAGMVPLRAGELEEPRFHDATRPTDSRSPWKP